MLAAGDVARLPLADDSVDAYYSGGVVEHFEAGPGPALDEAHRVLRPGGRLLISVPYASPLRRSLVRARRPAWQAVDRHQPDAPPPGRRFFQYVYAPAEFERLLAEYGFVVECRRPFSIVWGLHDAPLLGAVLARRGGRAAPPPRARAEGAEVASAAPGRPSHGLRALAKRLVVAEDETVPLLGQGVRWLGWFAANMMMYVCVPA